MKGHEQYHHALSESAAVFRQESTEQRRELSVTFIALKTSVSFVDPLQKQTSTDEEEDSEQCGKASTRSSCELGK